MTPRIGRRLAGQRDQGAEQRDPADKGFGAVDRVQNPDELGILARWPELLAEDAVLRKVPLDQRPHRRLRRTVGNSYRGQIGLVLDRDRLAEMRADFGAGGIGEAQREGDKGVEVDLGHRPISACQDRR